MRILGSTRDTVGGPYDLAVGLVGYESRARFVAERVSRAHPETRWIGYPFTDRHDLSYPRNRAFFERLGASIVELDAASMRADLTGRLIGLDAPEPLEICVDISSASRNRLAALVSALTDVGEQRALSVDFYYAGSNFFEPPGRDELIYEPSPVAPQFAGWSGRPGLPSVGVMGLGFEPDRAMAAAEYGEFSELYVFRPDGGGAKFRRAMLKANEVLLSSRAVRVLDYNIFDPLESFFRLSSLVDGLIRSTRPVLVPMGPKVFALACLLVASRERTVPVWRVSSREFGEPANVVASGRFSVMSVEFGSASLSPYSVDQLSGRHGVGYFS